MQFDTAQAAFLAGYLAAGMSKTGKVGTYGGLNPAGDHLHGRLRRRRGEVQQGQGQEGPGARLEQGHPERLLHQRLREAGRGQEVADALVAQGADIIMPVAGGPGLGTTAAAKASGGKYSAIWVDVDGCESTPDCPAWSPPWSRTSRTSSRTRSLTAAAGDKLRADPGFIGTLANNGV